MKKPTITAHAILRYAEYALGLDSAAIKKRILSVVPATDGTHPLGDQDLRARVVDGVIVTIVKPPRQYRRKRAKVKKPKVQEIDLEKLLPWLPPVVKIGVVMDEAMS